MTTENDFYRAAIFDLDGVLADTARFHFKAWRQLAHELGIVLVDEDEQRLKGLERMASLEAVLGEKSSAYTESDKQQLATRKNNHYKELIGTLSPADLLPGAGEVLTRLADAGIPLALASASKNAGAVIERLGIARCFAYIADANEVRHPKPHPEIFLKAAAGLGVAPVDCVGIEDAVAGVAAINSAGMRSVGVGEATELHEAGEVIASLESFPVQKYFAA